MEETGGSDGRPVCAFVSESDEDEDRGKEEDDRIGGMVDVTLNALRSRLPRAPTPLDNFLTLTAMESSSAFLDRPKMVVGKLLALTRFAFIISRASDGVMCPAERESRRSFLLEQLRIGPPERD